ncbi:MAG: extracellular solute-binding protein [Fimbriimonas sp.]|nr:extracellular solute-binding protein [Fimbriimonas sp.]
MNAIIKNLFRATLLLLAILCQALPAHAGTPVDFWAVTGSDDDVLMYKRLADRFHARTGIEVHITPLSWGNFATKYFTSMAAGMPPDIGATNLGGPMDYGSVGGLVDLNKEFPGEIDKLKAHTFPRLLPICMWRGQLFGVPAEMSTLALFYRTDIFRRLGLTPPQTWKELEETIRRLEVAGYHYSFGFPSRAQWAISLYTMPYDLPGIAMTPDDKVEVDWNNPKYIQGVLRALKLWYTHDSPASDQLNRVVGMFRSDDTSIGLPMFIDQPNYYLQLPISAPELKGKWSVVPWPRAEDGKPYCIVGGTTYVIFRKSKHKREAFEWLKYLYSVEAQEAMIVDHANRQTDSTFEMPPLIDMWQPHEDAFWSRPDVANVRGLKETLAPAMPSFTTLAPVHGASDAGRLEGNILDRMGTYITDLYSAEAGKHGLTRWDLIRKFAKGGLHTEEVALDTKIADRLKQEYDKAQPEAKTLIEKETRSYDERFGKVIGNLASFESKSNILTVIKWVASVILFGFAAIILALPKYRKHWVSYAFIAAPVVASIVFVFIPAATALYLSFTQYHPVLPLSSAIWSGMSNYAEVASSGDLYKSIFRTGIFLIGSLPLSIAISLPLAWFLNQRLVAQRYWRFLYFSPMVTSIVSIALIFTQLFLSSSQGWLNTLFLKLGLVRDPIQFLHSERSFLYCVIAVAIWQGLAFNILIFLAGLQQIPQQLYEAAAVDGASVFRRFRSISLPGLRAQLAFICILGVIGGFQVFEPIYVLGGGAGEAGDKFGPNDSGMTMVPLVYHTGFETFEMGKSTAIAYILFAVILVFSLIQLKLFRGKEESQ